MYERYMRGYHDESALQEYEHVFYMRDVACAYVYIEYARGNMRECVCHACAKKKCTSRDEEVEAVKRQKRYFLYEP